MLIEDSLQPEVCSSNLRFVARQGCAIRGHGDETDGNFYQLLKLCGDDHKMVRASNEL